MKKPKKSGDIIDTMSLPQNINIGYFVDTFEYKVVKMSPSAEEATKILTDLHADGWVPQFSYSHDRVVMKKTIQTYVVPRVFSEEAE